MLDKLLDNAKDYTPSGGRITIGIRDHIDTVGLWVQNEGPPLPIQTGWMHSRCSLGHVTIQPDHALGLGLYVVRLIAESMGGSGLNSNVDEVFGPSVTGLRVP